MNMKIREKNYLYACVVLWYCTVPPQNVTLTCGFAVVPSK